MFQSDAASTLISWFSVLDFTKNIKHAGDGTFSCASLCQKLSQYGIILRSYYISKKNAIFMPHSVVCVPKVVSSSHTDFESSAAVFEPASDMSQQRPIYVVELLSPL